VKPLSEGKHPFTFLIQKSLPLSFGFLQDFGRFSQGFLPPDPKRKEERLGGGERPWLYARGASLTYCAWVKHHAASGFSHTELFELFEVFFLVHWSWFPFLNLSFFRSFLSKKSL